MKKEEAIKSVRAAMKKLDLKYEFKKKDDAILLGMKAIYFFADIKLVIRALDNCLTFMTTSDTCVKKNIGLVAEYLLRINYSTSHGSLEMDCDDGTTRYFFRLPYAEIDDFSEGDKDDEIRFLTHFIVKSLMIYDICGTGIFSVMLEAESPEDAAKKSLDMLSKKENGDNDNDDDDDGGGGGDDDDDDDDDDGGDDDFSLDEDDEEDADIIDVTPIETDTGNQDESLQETESLSIRARQTDETFSRMDDRLRTISFAMIFNAEDNDGTMESQTEA